MAKKKDARKFAEARNAKGDVVMQLMCAAADDDALSVILRVLTHRLSLILPDKKGGGCFGGEYGYGVEFENETFLMHPYCWCDKEDGSCLWCLRDHPEFIPLLSARFGTTEDGYYDEATGYFDPPHFWHKPSGLRVRWYKYIGRGMGVRAEGDITAHDVLASCLESLGGPSVEQAVKEYEAAEEESARQMAQAAGFWASEEGQKAMQEMFDKGIIRTWEG